MRKPVKVVYLFGAGATHAEIVNLYTKSNDETFLKENGLLMQHVSKRVCENARKNKVFSGSVDSLLSDVGLSNIELFISLVENNVINPEKTINGLKNLISRDILARLTKSRRRRFYLHKSLFELHNIVQDSEELIGMISLNFDSVLDDAFAALRGPPNYCMTSGASQETPLLKLHGGFELRYRNKNLPIMTPGINKNYLELPYNFVWGRALEILIECDVLRVIGCSLSHNDIGLVDLLFKAHLARKTAFELQMIDFDPEENNIRSAYGFLPKITTALNIEGQLITDVAIRDRTVLVQRECHFCGGELSD